MRARDCVWRQPSDADRSPSIQLIRKLARYWVSSVEQEQVRRVRGHNPNSPQKGATPAPGALPRIRPQPKCRIYGRLCQGQARGCGIRTRMNQVVRKS